MTERRRQLIDAARRVFADRGFSGATTREIARAAGVTEAVIFQHFADKDALYAAILEQQARSHVAERWLAALQDRLDARDDRGMLQALYAGILDQLDRDPYLLRLMVYSALEQHPLARRLHAPGMRLYRILESFIVDGQRRGRFERGSPAVLVRAILALPIYYVMQRRLFRTPWPAADRDDLIATGIRMTLAGLTASTDRDEELS